MFDNVFDKAMPSKVTRYGWPWHGLARANYNMPINVELKNTDVITLDAALRANQTKTRQSTGTVVKFRDWRAPDVTRTPAEKAADDQRGIEWRADVVFPVHEKLLHGARVNTYGNASWLYNDGLKNWVVTPWSDSEIQLVELAPGGDDRSKITKFLPVTSNTFYGLGSATLLGASLDGSKACFGSANDIGHGESSGFDQSEVFRWFPEFRSFFELVINGNQAAYTRVFRGYYDHYIEDGDLTWKIGKTVGAFYDENDELKSFTFDCVSKNKWTYEGDVSTDNYYYFVLRRDGVKVSDVTYQHDYTSYSIVVDGVTVETGPRYLLPIDGVDAKLGRFAEQVLGCLGVSVVRYSGQIVALSAMRIVPAKDYVVGGNNVICQYIGTAATASPLPAQPGPVLTRFPPLGALYGSYNPITHEVVRDAPTPVFWI